MQPEYQLISNPNASSTLHLPIIYKPDKTSKGNYKDAPNCGSKVTCTELTDRIEKLIQEWCKISVHSLTNEKITSLSERTLQAIKDLNTLSTEYRIKSIPYVQNLSEKVLNNFYKRTKKEYRALVKGVFNISSNQQLDTNARWEHEKVWNHLIEALATEAYGTGKKFRNTRADTTNPNGISLYNQCVADHLRKKYKEEVSSFKRNKNISPIFPKDIWETIFAYFDLEALRLFRKTSRKARMFSDRRSLNKIGNKALLRFKENNGKLRGIHSNYSTKLQLSDSQLIAREFVKRWNAKEILTNDLWDLTSEPLFNINDWIDFLGDECKMIEHIRFFSIITNNNIRDVFSQLDKFTNLRELSLPISDDLMIPDSDKKKFPSIQSLHLYYLINRPVFPPLLALFPNTTELTFHYSKTNLWQCLNLPNLPTKIVLKGCRLTPVAQEIDLPVKYLSIIDPVFYEAKINVSFSNLTHFDVKNADINLEFLNQSPCLKSIVIDQKEFAFQPMKADLSQLKSSSLKTLSLIQRGDTPKISLKSSINLTLSDLKKFSSLETLTLQGILIDDFSDLAAHPKLQKLVLKNCTNMDTAEGLKAKGIEVIYEA